MKNQIDYSVDYSQVLKAMACTLGDYNFDLMRALFGRLFLRLKPLEDKVADWIKEGVLVGDLPRRYDAARRVHINPARWAEVMATVSHDQLPKLLASSPVKIINTHEAIGHLVSAFYHFQHGEPFVETLMLTDWSALMTTPQIIFIELIDYLTCQPELVTFTQQAAAAPSALPLPAAPHERRGAQRTA